MTEDAHPAPEPATPAPAPAEPAPAAPAPTAPAARGEPLPLLGIGLFVMAAAVVGGSLQAAGAGADAAGLPLGPLAAFALGAALVAVRVVRARSAPAAPAPLVGGSLPPPEAWTPEGPSAVTRALGALAVVLFGAAGFLLVRRVFQHDFGADNGRVLAVIRAAAVALSAYPVGLGLLAAVTGRQPAVRWNPLGLPFEGWWWRTLGGLTWREVRRVFFHPVAYVALFVFLVVNGILFCLLLAVYAGPDAYGRSFDLPASHFVTENVFLFLSLVLICPALTMRLLAEEQREGTLELLLTAPVTDIQVVLSKFLGTLTYYGFMISLNLAYLAVLAQYAPEWDSGPALGGYLGLGLMGALFLAIGLFASSITQSQIVAYLVAALPLLALILIVSQLAGIEGLPVWIRQTLRHLSVIEHQYDFASGVVQWKSLVFYLSGTVFFLFLAVRGLESRRWR